MTSPSQFSRFDHPDYIMWTVQTVKFLIVEPPLPILIPLGLKYSPQDPVFKYPWPCMLLAFNFEIKVSVGHQ